MNRERRGIRPSHGTRPIRCTAPGHPVSRHPPPAPSRLARARPYEPETPDSGRHPKGISFARANYVRSAQLQRPSHTEGIGASGSLDRARKNSGRREVGRQKPKLVVEIPECRKPEWRAPPSLAEANISLVTMNQSCPADQCDRSFQPWEGLPARVQLQDSFALRLR